VLRIYPDRGFGFIRTDDRVDYFFHRSSLDVGDFGMHGLEEGERVTFEPRQSPKGPRAERVQKAA